MSKVSKESASKVSDFGVAEDRTEEFDGYTVNFVSIRQDYDLAPMLKGLPDDRPSRALYVVVSGPPGSGKTTLATGIARQLSLPLMAKDLIKETLMSTLAVPDIATSRMIGQAAVEVMYAVAATSSGGAVLEANFHRSVARADIQALPGLIVEVFCRCDREVALTRYRERSEQRHPGHFDQFRADDELWNHELTTPVAGGWAVLEVNTNLPLETSGVVRDIRMLVGSR